MMTGVYAEEPQFVDQIKSSPVQMYTHNKNITWLQTLKLH
jgi:hypothetical protein